MTWLRRRNRTPAPDANVVKPTFPKSTLNTTRHAPTSHLSTTKPAKHSLSLKDRPKKGLFGLFKKKDAAQPDSAVIADEITVDGTIETADLTRSTADTAHTTPNENVYYMNMTPTFTDLTGDSEADAAAGS